MNKDSTRTLVGRKAQYTKDGRQIVESFSYGYSCQLRDFSERDVVLHVDRPRVPRLYTKSYYADVLKIRLEEEDMDELTSNIQTYLYYERRLQDLDYPGLVVLLLSSYPLLQSHNEELFDSLRRAAIVHQERDPVEFKRTFFSMTDFLRQDRPGLLRPLEKLGSYEIDPIHNPIPRLDILYTLRVWNTRAPFNCHIFSELDMKRAEEILISYDLAKFHRLTSYSPGYLYTYVKSKQCTEQSCASRLRRLFKL